MKPRVKKEIEEFFNCHRCLEENGYGPYDPHIEVGWTKKGIQVWCKYHDMNMIHIDFQGQKHPAMFEFVR